MAEYHFVSTWQIQAPIERVWEEIYHTERWPDRNARWVVTGAVLTAVAVLGWRRHASSR